MRLTRRDFLEETFRELASPLVSCLRYFSEPKTAEDRIIPHTWKKVGPLLSFYPGESLEIKDIQLEISSDELGIRAYRNVGTKRKFFQLEIRKSNELWVNLKEEWSPGAFLCHQTLQKKEE